MKTLTSLLIALVMLATSCASVNPAKRYAKDNKAYVHKNHKVR